MADNIVEAHGLRKVFGDTVAVDNVDLVVERGRVYGALGPNGSGKSTTVRMILGLAQPDAGEVRLFGERLTTDSPELLAKVGAVVEMPAFVPYLCGWDNLKLLSLYRPGPTEKDISRVLERVNLADAAKKRFKNYSLGMKQRLGIAAAILNDPELIVLDEPTNGLDPQGTREVRALIPELAAEGRTIVLCSHLLYEVEQVCDAVTIFQKGRVVSQGPVKDLIGTRSQLEVQVPDMAGAEAALRRSEWGAGVSRRNGSLVVEGAGDQGEALNRYLAAQGYYASVIRPIHHSLEDVFFELTGEPGHA